MEDRMVQFRVGVMVAATLLISGILLALFGKFPWGMHPTYTVHIKFAEARGVVADTPVRKSGILIGRVSKVAFDDQEGVIITAELHDDVILHAHDTARIVGSLLGDAEVQFAADPKVNRAQAGAPIGEGSVLQGRVAANPLQSLNDMEPQLQKVMVSMTGASDEVSKLAQRVNNLLVNHDEQISRIITKTERSLDSFQQTMRNIDDIVGDKKLRDDLKQSIAGLPKLLRDANDAVSGMQSTVFSAERNLKNLEGFTQPLGDRGEAIITQLDSGVGRLDELLGFMVDFSKKLNNRESTLGQLLNDAEAYDNLNNAAKNVSDLSRELKPIVADVKIFTDKIARHPSALLQGALKKDIGLKN